jgi:hypothetical protein
MAVPAGARAGDCSGAARYREAEEWHKDEGKVAAGVAERRQWRRPSISLINARLSRERVLWRSQSWLRSYDLNRIHRQSHPRTICTAVAAALPSQRHLRRSSHSRDARLSRERVLWRSQSWLRSYDLNRIHRQSHPRTICTAVAAALPSQRHLRRSPHSRDARLSREEVLWRSQSWLRSYDLNRIHLQSHPRTICTAVAPAVNY